MQSLTYTKDFYLLFLLFFIQSNRESQFLHHFLRQFSTPLHNHPSICCCPVQFEPLGYWQYCLELPIAKSLSRFCQLSHHEIVSIIGLHQHPFCLCFAAVGNTPPLGVDGMLLLAADDMLPLVVEGSLPVAVGDALPLAVGDTLPLAVGDTLPLAIDAGNFLLLEDDVDALALPPKDIDALALPIDEGALLLFLHGEFKVSNIQHQAFRH